ncbi:hypothetical protein [uncultured Desulfobacter sp.]|uniref:hypothetical protein n=1 Tax=uncultured Desulfobacter sp. TaxID=240139 RepID=UPI002AAC1C33|nr:hypothetical protein [uncultured Desulfobacter sp.]
MGYVLGGVTFNIKGADNNVKESVCIMFELAQRSALDGDLSFWVHEIQSSNPSELESVLPPWAVDKALSQPPSSDVYLYYGDSSDVISVAVDDSCVFCCYHHPMDKILRYVLYKKKYGRIRLSVSSVIVPTLSELFFCKSRVLFHAASLYIPESDIGIMIAADSGGGKTTTTLSLLRNAARMCSDDLTLVELGQDDTWNMSGLPERMNLTENTIQFFPELDAVKNDTAPNFYSKKYPVLISDVYGNGCMIQNCRLDLIYFISIQGDTPSVAPIRPSEGFGRLLKASTFAIKQKLSEDRASKLFSILHSVKIFKLNSGADPDQLGKWLIENSKKHLSS